MKKTAKTKRIWLLAAVCLLTLATVATVCLLLGKLTPLEIDISLAEEVFLIPGTEGEMIPLTEAEMADELPPNVEAEEPAITPEPPEEAAEEERTLEWILQWEESVVDTAEYEEQFICQDITVRDDYTSNDINSIFEWVNFPSIYDKSGTERYRLRILTAEETLYEFVYLDIDPSYRDYRWFAQQWPQGEYPFSFLCEHGGKEPVENWLTQKTIDHVPLIAGREAFCHKDIVGLRQSLGFTLGDCLNLVNTRYGEPESVKASYWDGIPSFAVDADYSFGSIFSIEDYCTNSIDVTDSSISVLRGLRVGDSYRKVLDSFPLEAEPVYQSGVEQGVLYQLGYAPSTDMDWELGGNLLYNGAGEITAINYVYTFPGELYEEGKIDWSLDGYVLRFTIENDLVSEIYIAALIDYV